jgi:hypothetical protein
MAVSLRRRYPGRLEGRNDDGPVSVPPTAGAQLPPVAEVSKPAAPLELEPSPAEQAARDAVKARIAELTETEPVQPVVIEREDPTEKIIANSGLPPRAQAWLRAHPDYVTDAAKNERMQKAHHVAEYQAGGQAFTDDYFNRMDVLLGFRPDSGMRQQPQQQPVTPQRQPVRQQGAPVSAPPHRDVPSYSTGRPASTPTQLTAEELALTHSLGISPETYREKKRLMNELKANGVIADGR